MRKASGKEGRLTIAEIAAAAGVSNMTVSRVLNQRADVAPATRAKIEQMIAQRGYVRNRAAQALRQGLSGRVDFVTQFLESDYLLEILRGVREGLDKGGLRMELSATYDDPRREREWLTSVTDRSIDGVILLLPSGQSGLLSGLRKQRIPFVTIDARSELDADVPIVSCTYFAGSLAATEYLLRLGHTRIALIGGTPILPASRARLAGYQAALAEFGVGSDPLLIRSGDYSHADGYQQSLGLLDLPEPPTAIIASNDLQASGVYQALYERHIRIPQQMSVIGFDDVPLSTFISPPLTTIRQPLADMGRLAVSMLQRLIDGETLETARVELATTLIIRESCSTPST